MKPTTPEPSPPPMHAYVADLRRHLQAVGQIVEGGPAAQRIHAQALRSRLEAIADTATAALGCLGKEG